MAGGVAVATSRGDHNDTTTSSGGASSVTTAAVVRTTLTTAVQVGGSIGFDDTYAITAPTGSSAQSVSQAEQAVAADQQALSADQTALTDAATEDNQVIAGNQSDIGLDRSTLGTDQASQAQDCAGTGASTPTCSQDTETVEQDQSQLAQAEQQLTTSQATAHRDDDQSQAKVQSDRTKLLGDESTLEMLEADSVNPGTTYTALPSVGDIIREDQSVYSVNNEVVPLLYGSIPAYRTYSVGMSDGADVGELTKDLIALGDGVGLAQSNHYSAATAAAVERWQRTLGLPATGESCSARWSSNPVLSGSLRSRHRWARTMRERVGGGAAPC